MGGAGGVRDKEASVAGGGEGGARQGDAEFHSAMQQEVLEAVVPQRVASDSALIPLSAFGPKSTWASVRMPLAWTAGGSESPGCSWWGAVWSL